MVEGQAVYSATPLKSNPSDRFISNEVFDFESFARHTPELLKD